MIRNTLLAAGITYAVFFANMAAADDFDKKTNITVNETILIPGKTLPPGKYVMKLLNATANRHVVQIFNEDQTKLQATILAFNNYRLQPAEKTILQYWETPSGSPPALRAWFYPGDNFGQEFAYPKKLADQLSKANNNAKVPNYEGPEAPAADTLASVKVEDAAEAPLVTREPEPAPLREEPPNNTILAQNTPPPAPPVRQEATPPPPSPAEPAELPQTASNVPLIAFLGVVLLALAAIARTFIRT